MLNFFISNIGTIIVSLILLIIVGFAVRSLISNKKTANHPAAAAVPTVLQPAYATAQKNKSRNPAFRIFSECGNNIKTVLTKRYIYVIINI